MKHGLLPLLTLLTLLWASNPLAGEEPAEQWEKVKEKNGILVYTRETPGSRIITAKSLATLPATPDAILRVLGDNAGHTRWVHSLLESREIEMISHAERVEYNRFDAPWPASDRDFVYRVNIDSSETGDRINIRMRSEPNPRMPEQDGIIRAQLLESTYNLSRKGEESTEVELIFRADPRGWIPIWLTNLVQRAWTYQVMKGLRGEVKRVAAEGPELTATEGDIASPP